MRGKKLDPLIFDEKLPSCVIFDLDGTLACVGDRSPYDAKACGVDAPNESIVYLAKLISKANISKAIKVSNDVKIIIFSGRMDNAELHSKEWLQRFDVPFDEIHLRKFGDYRKDSVVKKELFNRYIKDKYNVLFVVDDRSQVVDMWRELGLTTLQCAPGNF